MYIYKKNLFEFLFSLFIDSQFRDKRFVFASVGETKTSGPDLAS